MDFSNYNFKYGKSYEDSNVYYFLTEDNKELRISEKVGKFVNGCVSQYLLFEYTNSRNREICEYIDRKTQDYKDMINIRPIVDNLNGITMQCTNCKTIVLKEQITSGKGDKCVYCDKYLCKKCKKFFPIIELDEDRLCEKCRSDK